MPIKSLWLGATRKLRDAPRGSKSYEETVSGWSPARLRTANRLVQWR